MGYLKLSFMMEDLGNLDTNLWVTLCSFYNVSSVFQMYIASVLISTLHMFYTYIVSVLSRCYVCLNAFSSVFRCFCMCCRHMFQVFYLSSFTCGKCCIWMFEK